MISRSICVIFDAQFAKILSFILSRQNLYDFRHLMVTIYFVDGQVVRARGNSKSPANIANIGTVFREHLDSCTLFETWLVNGSR